MRYILRWIRVMYDRKIYRESHEGRFERRCLRLEQKWKEQYERNTNSIR